MLAGVLSVGFLAGANTGKAAITEEQLQQVQWEKGKVLQNTKDGGHIVGVEVRDFAKYSDYYLAKLDANGILQWKQKVAGSRYTQIHMIRETKEGGIVCVQTNNPSGASSRWLNSVYKLDKTGRTEWTTLIGAGWYYTPLVEATSVKQTEDGGYLLNGMKDNKPSVWRLNSLGAIEWIKTADEIRSEEQSVHELKFDSQDYSVIIGQTLDTVLSSVYGNQRTDVTKYGTFTSGDPSIGSVDHLGNITGLKNGQTVITATYKGKQTTANVFVYGVSKAATGTLKLDSNDYSLTRGQTLDTVTTVVINGKKSIIIAEVTYSISDHSVANIDSAGNITGLKPGVTKLMVSYKGIKTTANVHVY